jgi:hypothetical protein
VLDQIASELFPRTLKSEDPENVRRSALALFFYCISYQQASLVKSLILKAHITPELLGSDQFRCSFAILPFQGQINKHAKRMTVAIRLGQNECSERFYAVKFFNNRIEPIKIEKLSLEDNPDKCHEMFREFGYDLAVLQGMTK